MTSTEYREDVLSAHTICVVIPWRDPGDVDRSRAMEATRAHYTNSGFPVLVIDDGLTGTFNLSRARNRGMESLSDSTIALVVDADMLIPADQVRDAARMAAADPGVVLPFDRWRTDLTKEQTSHVLAQLVDDRPPSGWHRGKTPSLDFQSLCIDRPSYLEDGVVPKKWYKSPAYVLSVKTWKMIGGWDERHEGWSPEDEDFLWGSSLIAPIRVVPGHCYQLYHAHPVFESAFTRGTKEHMLHTRGVALNQFKQALINSLDYWRHYTSSSRRVSDLPEWFRPDGFMRAGIEDCRRALQIGCYTGSATEWLMEFTHAEVWDVDTFKGSDDESVTDWQAVKDKYQTRVRPYAGRIHTYVGTSDGFFKQNQKTFDLIYIDGLHRADQVLKDAINAHHALEVGGVLGFDDYIWYRNGSPDGDVPRTGIDAFLNIYQGEYRVIVSDEQLWLRKVGDGPVRIAVYSPAKNESDNVLGWYESARGADEIVLVDTGSTDDTVEVASSINDPVVKVRSACITPWRFDAGFNAALSQVSDDIDIAVPLHLDERLQPGWRSELEKAWAKGGRQFGFNYQWSETLSFRHDRIHARRGYLWKYPAHETPAGTGPKVETELTIVQERDNSKDRSQDEALIHLMLEENPDDPRAQYYSAREHWYRNEWDKARTKFLKYLANPASTYDQERSEACRYMAKMVYDQYRLQWFVKACSEAPQRREVWADLAVYALRAGFLPLSEGAAAMANSITEKTSANSFHVESWCWMDSWWDHQKQTSILG